ncbi:hypothetical protein B0A54_09752 [Friedmanniomyces endolithicus]|uniref:Uncharacterized protein n=1 Tax=Friedmanniomyces endolithicus TaxID=329885 RepID=A0A4U0UPK9_9PEZI|nr:hypothetical protein B0A54_09752 [Friedmanniomyces endolithicus]
MEAFIEHVFHLEMLPAGVLPALTDDAGVLEAAARISSPRHEERAKKASIKMAKHKRKTINAMNQLMRIIENLKGLYGGTKQEVNDSPFKLDCETSLHFAASYEQKAMRSVMSPVQEQEPGVDIL